MMQAAQIRFLLKIHNKTQRDVARHLGVSEAAVSQVINGNCRSELIEKTLARIMGVSRKVLFPPTLAA